MTADHRPRRRGSVRRLGALVVAAAVAVPLVASSLTTQAQWRATETTSVGQVGSDSFGLTATARDLPMGTLWTTPNTVLTNTATDHRAWVDVQSAQLNEVPQGESRAVALRNDVSLTYRVQTADCLTGTGSYWAAKAAGSTATSFIRASTQVTGADIAAGQSAHLCPWVQSTATTTTPAGQSQFLRDYAGRVLQTSTAVRQRSAAPATWASAPAVVQNSFRVAFPAPTIPSSDNETCVRTDINGGRAPNVGTNGGIYWGWPFSGDTSWSGVDSPAVWAFEIMARPTGSTVAWQALRSTRSASNATTLIPANQRRAVGLPTAHLDRIAPPTRPNFTYIDLKIRAYPFTNNREQYVESTWIHTVYNDPVGVHWWNCSERRANPDAGSHNMP